MTQQSPEVLVIGGGPAGLGAAAALRRRGIDALVLERAPEVGDTWRQRYDGLRLNTVSWMSGLPGMRIPRRFGRWPTRDDYVRYLEQYVADQRLRVRTGVAVERVDRDAGRYLVRTRDEAIPAAYVVVATGYDHSPRVPDWPGRDGFRGELIHSSAFRNPEPFRGRRVLVVGLGNSGLELAVQLAEAGAASVAMSMRTPPNIAKREILGVPATLFAELGSRMSAIGLTGLVDRGGALMQRLLWGDLSDHGIPRSPYGVGTEMKVRGLGPVADCGFIDAVRAGRVEVVPALAGFDGDDAILSGGARLRADAVIAATGYGRGLERLVGHLGVLGPTGLPEATGGESHPLAPGLYFNGYRLPLPGVLPAMRRSSVEIAKAVVRERRRHTNGSVRP